METKKAIGEITVIEWAPFHLAPGVSEAALLAASKALQEDFLARQPGFVGRELLRGAGGRFVDMVRWGDRASAETAMVHSSRSAACARYFALMVPPDPSAPHAGVEHLEHVAGYGCGGDR